MKKILLLLILASTILFSCQHPIERAPRFDELYRHFEKNGLKMRGAGALNEVIAQSNKAIQFMISDRAVGIYFYNLKNPIQAERLAKAKKEKQIFLLGSRYETTANGQYLLVGAADHLDGEKIIEAFEKFE